HHFRARAALAYALTSGDAAALRVATRDAKAIERERMPWSKPMAALLRAGIASLEGDRGAAVAHARGAADGFDGVNMALHAAAARYRLGALVGGEEGRTLVERAETWMRSETVKNFARLTDMLAPGFARAPGA